MKPKSSSNPAATPAPDIGAPKRRGRKVGEAGNFVPTDDQRKLVELAAELRIPHDEMAALIINPSTGEPICERTLEKVFEQEIRRGYSMLRLRIHQAKVKAALEGNATLIIWTEKTLFNVRENVDVVLPETSEAEAEGTIEKARRIAFTLAVGAHKAERR